MPPLLSQIFYPLQGFLIFFIYLRPSIVSIKRRNPSYTSFQVVKAAITSRGEDPKKLKRRRTFKKLTKRASIRTSTNTSNYQLGASGTGGAGVGEQRRHSLVVCTGGGQDKDSKDSNEEGNTNIQLGKRSSETDLSQSERSSQRVRLAPGVLHTGVESIGYGRGEEGY